MMLNEGFEKKFQAEESDSTAETNIVGESAFDREIEDQPQEIELVNKAEKTSKLNEEDFETKSCKFEIPFEKSDSSAETNIAGERLKTNNRKLSCPVKLAFKDAPEIQNLKTRTSQSMRKSPLQ